MKRVLQNQLWLTALLIAILVAGLGGCAGTLGTGPDPAPIGLTILFFNDIHGHLLPFEVTEGTHRREVGGIARMAAQVESIRAENRLRNRRTYLLIAGDILQGTPLSTVFHGRPDVECFNAMGVDAMAVGNHEFDFGTDNLRQLEQLAHFPFLSANIREKATGKLLYAPSAAFALPGKLTLTVVGVTTDELKTTTRPAYVRGLSVQDPLQSVRSIVKTAAKSGPVVLLSHNRHRVDRQIAASLPELAAIIAGHDHLLFAPYRKVNGVAIFEALDNGRYLGRIDLLVDPVTGKAVLESSRYLPITLEMPDDPAIERIVAVYQGQLGERFKEVIGQSTLLLDGRRDQVRYEETALGDFVTDVMREYTGADIALVNAGALRASIDPGPVTLEDVFRTLPFENQILRVQLTGRDLMAALERSVHGTREDQDGGFLQVSGLRLEVKGHRVSQLEIENAPGVLPPEATYSVAMPDFLAAGGDGYRIFVGKPALNTRLSLRDVVVDAIRARRIISAPDGGRILRTRN